MGIVVLSDCVCCHQIVAYTQAFTGWSLYINHLMIHMMASVTVKVCGAGTCPLFLLRRIYTQLILHRGLKCNAATQRLASLRKLSTPFPVSFDQQINRTVGNAHRGERHIHLTIHCVLLSIHPMPVYSRVCRCDNSHEVY